MAEEQKRKFGELYCPVCGANLGTKVQQDMLDRTMTVCPQCDFTSPVLSIKQQSANGSLWATGIGGLAVGIFLRYSLGIFDWDFFEGLARVGSVIALVVGGFCLVCVNAIRIARKVGIKQAKQKWQAEHPAS